LRCSTDAKRTLIEPEHPNISLRRQCELIGLHRSSWYYQPAGESTFNLQLMRLIDEQYLRTPFYGSPKMTAWLRRQGHKVNPKRIARLMRLMGLQAIYPNPKTSIPGKDHRIYPYLLRDLEIVHPNQVWCSDITYVPMARGFMYLVAVMDWNSRFVLSWQLSNTMDTHFCLEALHAALHYGKPSVFNTDQGAQFTSLDFTSRLSQADIRISMDGRGRATDNIFIERLWRSVKYEEVYLKDYETVMDLDLSLLAYFRFYNYERPHQSLGYKTPAEVHFAEDAIFSTTGYA
jgi:putative transposase